MGRFFTHSYEQESDSDSSSIGDCSLAVAGLRGNVSQGDPCFAGPFFKDLEKDVSEQEDESSSYSDTNEGIIFYKEVGSATEALIKHFDYNHYY